MKCHIGVDAGTGYVHTVTATSANVHDITEAHNLLREDDEVVYGDSGYIGIEKREEIKNDENLSKIDFRITRRPKSLPKVSDNSMDWERYIDYRKSSVRSKIFFATNSAVGISVRLLNGSIFFRNCFKLPLLPVNHKYHSK